MDVFEHRKTSPSTRKTAETKLSEACWEITGTQGNILFNRLQLCQHIGNSFHLLTNSPWGLMQHRSLTKQRKSNLLDSHQMARPGWNELSFDWSLQQRNAHIYTYFCCGCIQHRLHLQKAVQHKCITVLWKANLWKMVILIYIIYLKINIYIILYNLHLYLLIHLLCLVERTNPPCRN